MGLKLEQEFVQGFPLVVSLKLYVVLQVLLNPKFESSSSMSILL